MTRRDCVTHVALAVVFFAVLGPFVFRSGWSLGAGLYIAGASLQVVVAVFATLIRGQITERSEHPFLDWMVKRGLLYLQTQTPIITLLVAVFLKLVPYPIMAYTILFAFVALPLWVSHRTAVSRDPDEPVHHLARYALWALVPVPIFSLVRIPTHYLFGQAYWHPWYDFGAALTGLPVNQLSSLAAGAFLYTLQGYAVALGFFILFERRTLLNGILYVCVFDSSIYSFIFADLFRVGMPTPPRWHAVAWSAHLLMACALWYAPQFWRRIVVLRLPAQGLVLIGVAAILIAPYAFAARRAIVWQYPTQRRIDRELFVRPGLLRPVGAPTVIPGREENRYLVRFAIGPRSYRNYVKKLRTLDVRDVEISGRLRNVRGIVAWCRSSTVTLESTDRFEGDAPGYPAKVRELDTQDLLMTCVGPPEAYPGALTLEWESSARLVGDLGQTVRKDSSRQERPRFDLVASDLRGDPRW